MNITELDEWQGLTAEMVREWLLANQWEPCGSSAAHLYYQCGSGEISEALLHEDLGWVIDLLALSYERSVQSILREINPRMRKGWPSDEALSAHPFWLLNNAPIHCLPSVVTSSFVREKKQRSDPEFADIAPHYAWPCDEHGNKVRWPTDSEGKML